MIKEKTKWIGRVFCYMFSTIICLIVSGEYLRQYSNFLSGQQYLNLALLWAFTLLVGFMIRDFLVYIKEHGEKMKEII